MREERQAEFNRAMEEHKLQLKRLRDEDKSDNDPESEDEEGEEGWEGIEEPPAVDYEAEYIDEDKYTTVTVEEMDASREGLRKSVREDDPEEEKEKEPVVETAEPEKKPKKSWRSNSDKPKTKKKKFRYESKGERRLTQAKQRLSKSKKATARREK